MPKSSINIVDCSIYYSERGSECGKTIVGFVPDLTSATTEGNVIPPPIYGNVPVYYIGLFTVRRTS